MKKALISGITGQDGSFLAELLIEKGYEVHGIIRRSSSFNTGRIEHLYADPHDADTKLFLHYGDITDGSRMSDLMRTLKPDEVYHLAAMSHVRVSFDEPVNSVMIDAVGTINMLEAIRNQHPTAKFYNAASSEMYGLVQEVPQTEKTPFYPRSPYACSKVYSYWQTRNYREAYNMHASNGILFNHDSSRRGATFVTRKITIAAARIALGLQGKLHLGNLDAKRDFGHAQDYVKAMVLMLQQSQSDDYVISTGETHSVREFLELVFGFYCLDVNKYVEIDPRYFRPSEVDILLGDSSKAREKLGWKPKYDFKSLALDMSKADYELARKESVTTKDFEDWKNG